MKGKELLRRVRAEILDAMKEKKTSRTRDTDDDSIEKRILIVIKPVRSDH